MTTDSYGPPAPCCAKTHRQLGLDDQPYRFCHQCFSDWSDLYDLYDEQGGRDTGLRFRAWVFATVDAPAPPLATHTPPARPTGWIGPKPDFAGRELGGALARDGYYDLCHPSLERMGYELEADCIGFTDPSAQLTHMRKLVNEYRWNPGFGQKGALAWRDPSKVPLWRPVTSSEYHDRPRGQGYPRVADMDIVVVTSERGAHYVVKCYRSPRTPQQVNRLLRECKEQLGEKYRWEATRQTGPQWLEPAEYLDGGSGIQDHEEATKLAGIWRAQIAMLLADDVDEAAMTLDLPFSPERMPAKAAPSDVFDEVLDQLTAEAAAVEGRWPGDPYEDFTDEDWMSLVEE